MISRKQNQINHHATKIISRWILLGFHCILAANFPTTTSFTPIFRNPYNSIFFRSSSSTISTRSIFSKNSHRTTKLYHKLPVQAIQNLAKEGYVILPGFLPPDVVSSLRSDVFDLRSKNKFQTAKIGQDSTNELNTNIRIAETCFLGPNRLKDVPSSSRKQLYETLDGIRTSLSGNTILDGMYDRNGEELISASPTLDPKLSELLYAYYPKGGFYKRHVDAVKNSASVLRSYSLLLYLNDDWKEQDGGCLRIHLDSGGEFLPPGDEQKFIDVKPEGGTLVLFRSELIPHEVLNTGKERLAIIGWYNRYVSSAEIGSLASDQDKTRSILLLMAAGLVTIGVGMLF